MADEPTTILGVTVQAWILESLRQLQEELKAALIMVTHDFGVVTQMASKIMVMYAGHLVELADKRDILLNPGHPYTLGLIRSVPIIEARSSRRLKVIPGFPPDMTNLKPGCPFAPRCERAAGECLQNRPPLVEVSENHWSACYHPIAPGEVDILGELES
jgi:oligopeptide/dipeptide ABC transporter ATP-binding protein